MPSCDTLQNGQEIDVKLIVYIKNLFQVSDAVFVLMPKSEYLHAHNARVFYINNKASPVLQMLFLSCSCGVMWFARQSAAADASASLRRAGPCVVQKLSDGQRIKWVIQRH